MIANFSCRSPRKGYHIFLRRWRPAKRLLHSAVDSGPLTKEAFVKPKSIGKLDALNPEQLRYLDSAIRVNQTGELAAVLIYAAQTPVLVRKDPSLQPLMKHMYDQEVGHFNYFNKIIATYRIRPTIMYPIWRVAATTLGWTTAMMGKEAAMACTEAVEIEIADHYNAQLRELVAWRREMQDKGMEFGEDMIDLTENIRRIRDEELQHMDIAIENDAKDAHPYELLMSVIRGGCRAAIWVSERV